MKVKVEDFTGCHEAADITGLEELLRRRDQAGHNSFWISHEGHRYPSLSLLVSGYLATLHYFPKESHPGFVPAGNIAGLKSGDMATFYIDKGGEQVEILNTAVVPAEVGFAVAKEFFFHEALPNRIMWNEL
jgi:hypothetical protein